MINTKKMTIGFLVIGVLVMLSFSMVSAVLGISKDYGILNPVKVGPGETKEIVFGRLQNTGDKEKTVEIEVLEGSEIVTLVSEETMTLAAGSTNNEVKVKVSIPEDITEGTEYDITIRYKDVTPSEGEGMVTILTSSQSTIPVLVEKVEVEEEEPVREGLGVWWWVVIIAVLAVVVWIVFKMMKK